MTAPPPPADRRPGFTLIEMLLVIAIIAVLAALLLVGISRAYVAVRRSQAVFEINQQQIACNEFKREFGFFPPSEFTIPRDSDDPGGRVLKRMFRSFPFSDTITPAFAVTWGGNYAGAPFLDTLDGPQSLVFFLGGPEGTGWDPANPLVPPTGSTKKGPFYEFPRGRLKPSFGPGTGTPDGRYRDPWGTPYAYFRSRGSRYADAPYPSTPSDAATRAYYADSVVVETRAGRSAARPMFDGPAPSPPGREKWINVGSEGGVQIISAGPDRLFAIRLQSGQLPDPTASFPDEPRGWRGSWTPGAKPFTAADPGFDDLANFNNGVQLGADASSTR